MECKKCIKSILNSRASPTKKRIETSSRGHNLPRRTVREQAPRKQRLEHSMMNCFTATRYLSRASSTKTRIETLLAFLAFSNTPCSRASSTKTGCETGCPRKWATTRQSSSDHCKSRWGGDQTPGNRSKRSLMSRQNDNYKCNYYEILHQIKSELYNLNSSCEYLNAFLPPLNLATIFQ